MQSLSLFNISYILFKQHCRLELPFRKGVENLKKEYFVNKKLFIVSILFQFYGRQLNVRFDVKPGKTFHSPNRI